MFQEPYQLKEQFSWQLFPIWWILHLSFNFSLLLMVSTATNSLFSRSMLGPSIFPPGISISSSLHQTLCFLRLALMCQGSITQGFSMFMQISKTLLQSTYFHKSFISGKEFSLDLYFQDGLRCQFEGLVLTIPVTLSVLQNSIVNTISTLSG